MIELLAIIGTIGVIYSIVFFIPKTQEQLINRMEEEGYRHVVVIKNINPWVTEVNANHNNLATRCKFKVFYTVGIIEIDVISQV
jgi:hypothetical protein